MVHTHPTMYAILTDLVGALGSFSLRWAEYEKEVAVVPEEQVLRNLVMPSVFLANCEASGEVKHLTRLMHLLLPSKDSDLKAFGPKDPII